MSSHPRLRPREHGAYAMMAFPTLSGLAMGGVSWSGVAFVAITMAGFLAHESVLVVLGGRGERIRSKQEIHARARLGRLAGVAAVAVAVFAVTAPAAAWAPAGVAAALAAGVATLLLTGRTKSVPGELLVAAAFASVHAVLATAGGRGPQAAFLPSAAWALSFAVATLSVHGLKARFKGRGPTAGAVLAAPVAAAAVILATTAAWLMDLGAAPAGFALVPKAMAVLALSVMAVHPKHLKRVGWTFVAADGATLLLLSFS